jgi:hypothetical protein
MIHANRVPLLKKSFNRSSISLRVLLSERISTAKSGAPGKKRRVERLNPSAFKRARLTKEISGARTFKLFMRKPVLESQTAPRRLASAKARRAEESRVQISP